MDRRAFLAMTGTTAAMLGGIEASAQDDAAGGGRDYYELKRYLLDTEEQRAGLDAFLAEAALPALERHGFGPVGVFVDPDEISPVYVLIRHKSLDTLTQLLHILGGDAEFMEKGTAFLNAPAKTPAYARMESSLLYAFSGMPQMARPTDVPGRVFQLRIYESPTVLTGQTKIEMFNSAEIAIFHKCGMTPVFFGEAIVGDKLPNLTYMLGFESRDAQNAAWKTFVQDPDWKELSARPEYANDKIISHITNLNLVPTAYSQI
ncbi:MAG: NIPSNAP family containing protein [Candidatus Hydrogenedens sp.]|nr:NIPSNAP family containing protein [Candidatus Hydrogenedens sp.]